MSAAASAVATRRSAGETLAALPPRVAAAVADAKAGLVALYGDRLARVVLYGSQARGDARPDSDIDLLVVLRGDVYGYGEIRRMGELKLDLLLRYEIMVSMLPYAEGVARARVGPFLENVHAYGVDL